MMYAYKNEMQFKNKANKALYFKVYILKQNVFYIFNLS